MNKNSKYFAVQQAANSREAHVYIFGDITTWRWEESDVTSYDFKSLVGGLDADTIHVHINSYGGSVSEGWAIYNTLRDHPAKVITHGDGFVASAALYPFLAGDERIASNLSAYYLHQVLMYVNGNSDDLRAAADEADKMTEIGLSAFTSAGIDAEKIKALMQKETWLDAEEALELGIATSIVADEALAAQQSAKRLIVQRMTAKPAQIPAMSANSQQLTVIPAPGAERKQKAADVSGLFKPVDF